MKTSKIAWGLIALVAGLGLGACGGGGGTAAAGKNTTVGVVSAFGSVYVNGCEYETDSASIYVEGQSSSEDDLSVGDVVVVTGPSNCTQADAVSINSADELEGWVTQNASVATDGTVTFEAMAQPVKTTVMTTFEDYTGSVPTLADIVVDNVVEVHGFTTPDGITATRVEVKSADVSLYAGELELKGLVINLDSPIVGSFDIGGLTINYTSASSYPQNLANGLFVEVKFDTSKNPTIIEIEDDGKLGYHGDDDEELEIYGILTGVLNGDVFYLGDQKVQVTTTTEYEEVDEGKGPQLDVLLADPNQVTSLYLEVEGYFVDGVLVADSVEFEDDTSDNNECKGTVTNLALEPGELNMGTLTVDASLNPAECEGLNSLNVTVNNSTIMEDDSSHNDSKFNLSALQNGELVEVYFDPDTGTAIKLERED